MFSHKKSGAFNQSARGQKMSAAALRIPKQDIVAELVPHIRDAANNNSKELAQLGDVGPDTAKNWLEGRNLPGLATFINMARISPELRAVAIKLMDPNNEFDPEWQMECLRFAKAVSQKMESKMVRQ